MVGASSNHIRFQAALESSVLTDRIASGASRGSIFVLVSLGLLTIALGYAVFKDGGNGLLDWNVSLLVVGLVAFTYWLRTPPTLVAPSMQPWLQCAVVLLPCCILLQIIPLPLPLMRLVSPERARLFDALKTLINPGAFVPLSIATATTFAFLFRILGYTVTFLLIRDITARSSQRHPWWTAAPLICIAGIEAAFGFLHSTEAGLVQGTYANKNHFAGVMEMVLPLAVMYAAALFKTRAQNTAAANFRLLQAGAILLIAVLIFLGLLHSLSKMGVVSGLCALFVMAVLALRAAKFKLWKKYAAVLGLTAVFLFGFVFFPPDGLVQAFGGLSSTTGGRTEGRWPIWMDTLRLIRAFPVFGCGLGNYETGFLKYQTAVVDRDFTFAHNDYLELAAELGGVGLIILAGLMVPIALTAFRAATRGADRSTRYIALGCAGAMTAMALHSLTDFNMYIPANAMLLAWICGISAGLPSSPMPASRPEPVSNRTFITRFGIVISCLLVVYASAWTVFETQFSRDPQTERLFCRFGICDTDAVVAAETRQHGGTIAGVPIPQLVEAVRRDMAAPQRWCDLGEAMSKAGKTGEARYCFSRALALGPDIPFTLVRAADFHFNLKENRRALELTARAIQLDTAYTEAVFGDYERRGLAIDDILRYGLPSDALIRREYFRRLLREARASDAVKAWDSLRSLGYSDDKLTSEYVAFLMSRNEYEAAHQVWASYTGARDKEYLESNRVFNGDFELNPAGSPFDWRIEPSPGAAIDFDRHVHYSGTRSLRIQFDGTENVGAVGVGQTVVLKPGQYRFQAYLRTKDVSTDEGVGFRVVDPESPKRLSFTTDSLLASNDWTLVEHLFQVPPGTGVIEVSLVRKPSLKFDNLIRGTVWVDQVSISPDREMELGGH